MPMGFKSDPEALAKMLRPEIAKSDTAPMHRANNPMGTMSAPSNGPPSQRNDQRAEPMMLA